MWLTQRLHHMSKKTDEGMWGADFKCQVEVLELYSVGNTKLLEILLRE